MSAHEKLIDEAEERLLRRLAEMDASDLAHQKFVSHMCAELRLLAYALVDAARLDERAKVLDECIKATCMDCRRQDAEHHPEWGWIHRRGMDVVDCDARHIRTAEAIRALSSPPTPEGDGKEKG